jgi:hypothetical protein
LNLELGTLNSFFVNPRDLPKRSFVKRRRQLQQTFADEKEEKPGNQNAERAVREPQKPREYATPGERLARQFFQAGGADHAVVMLGDTLPAEIMSALRATRHRFASGMIETTLMSQILHSSAKFRK